MILRIDAQLSPALAPWLAERFGIQAFSTKYLGFRDATDRSIFQAAREVGAVVMTKGSDFIALLEQYGPPPQVLWVTLGNTSNARMREVLERVFSRAVALIEGDEPLIEIRDQPWVRTEAQQWLAGDGPLCVFSFVKGGAAARV